MAPEPRPAEGINKYGDLRLTDEEIRAGAHRGKVGRGWKSTGKLQMKFLRSEGLKPTSKLLDVGCGAARAGILLAEYLQPNNYYGIDVDESLIRAALIHELPLAGVADKVPAENLRVTERFDSDFGVKFDFAIAQSVFTHLPLNHIKLCFSQLALVMAPGGRFYATFFEAPPSVPYYESVKQPVRTTWSERDPFHYRRDDLRWAAESSGDWKVRYIGDWGHARGQLMMEYTYAPGGAGAQLSADLTRQLKRRALRERRRLGRLKNRLTSS